LLTTALAAPAFAQIEEVVVTAQKKAEDIQTVPIAISAFTSQDLAAHQIKMSKDLQFSIPNVTFSNGAFGSSNFQIRGIGTASVATSGDAGVSINQNEVYLTNGAVLATGSSYYDIERIEVARGPQGTLFGQNATGGAINVITAKPNLDEYHADLEGTYGNYNDQEVRAMANIPIIAGQLGVRLAGFWESRDGDITNVYDQYHSGAGLPTKLDSHHDYSFRSSARWQPTADTTVDFVYSHSHEADSRVRTVVEACTNDPSGILGCLPSARHFQNINLNATTNTTLLSNIGPAGGLPLQLFQITGASPDEAGSTQVIPTDYRKVNSDFQPSTRGKDDFMSLSWKQKWFGWLESTFIGAFDHNAGRQQQATEGTPGDSFSQYMSTTPGVTRVQAAQAFVQALWPANGAYYSGSNYGLLPISAAKGYGLSSGSIRDYADHMQGYDQISDHDDEKSFELRFATSFNGPLNFLLGGSHLEYTDNNPYYVAQSGIDFASVLFGSYIFGNGNLAGPSVYDNNTIAYKSKSNGVFGEVYYDIIPDTLKFTAGLRWTSVIKTNLNQQSTLSCPVPIGSTVAQVSAILSSAALCPASTVNTYGAQASTPLFQQTKFSSTTGRGVLTWTPKVDWTDQTLVYASYSHGNRPGGFNPPSFIPGLIPNTFGPENVDAYEVGTKNLLLDGTLQANMTSFYYDYKGYQISSIVNRSALNSNVNATVYGAEGEYVWAPDSHWAFNLNIGLTHSSIGNGNNYQVDPRNPTHGATNAMVLKDYQGSNCIIEDGSGGPVTVASMNALAAGIGMSANTFIAPPSALPGSVAAASAYINASSGGSYGLTCATLGSALHHMNASLGTNFVLNYSPLTAITGDPNSGYNTPGGIAVNVKGNQLPDVPSVNISFGAQYSFDLDGGYTLVPRLDYYWKSAQYSEIFNTAEGRVPAWDELNGQIQLNSPDQVWYARAWVKNAFNKANVTHTGTGSDAQGLFTTLFVEDPRTLGVTVGAHF
jgi:outer membrane receptor protein involved in Fe transport